MPIPSTLYENRDKSPFRAPRYRILRSYRYHPYARRERLQSVDKHKNSVFTSSSSKTMEGQDSIVWKDEGDSYGCWKRALAVLVVLAIISRILESTALSVELSVASSQLVYYTHRGPP
ncbi:uncharacterized protein EV420DRAFT_1751275 [Desarmillaria tabescens]|uniref:Uncharacterized protein n=1 Tax=Armillaria tabescens TaxID=1929756 RepID=A0AA39JQF8_ARMTA|nr:uncharacterized protein EV420DRAFT_1751275 [Desarmillaria tabescens]KAK0447036.1 hypothetical protein EV420DRAFT_1751275 [Desarmillaria tabescens]